MRQVTFQGRQVTEHDLNCPDCGSVLVLTSMDVKLIYRCAKHRSGCQATHSANSDGSPVGIPAPWPVRAVRRKTHAVFALLCTGSSARMTREAAYRWLQGAMQMTPEMANISRFDIAQCELVLALIRADFGLEPEPDPGEGQVGFYNVRL